MRALVTGSEGFLGRHFVEALSPSYEVVKIDIKNGWDCRDLAYDYWDEGRFDLVLHCAATVGGREGIDYNAALLGANNLQLDGAMFEWALREPPGRFVYFSSAAAYPVMYQETTRRMRESLVDLATVDLPDESYGWAKVTGEVIAQRVRDAGVAVTVVRPFSTYDYDQDDCYPFPEFIKRAKRRDDPFVVWGDGGQVRDWIHVDDLVAAVLALVRDHVDGPVNLGTGVGTSMDELAQLCMTTAGYEAPIEHLLDKPMGVRYRVADNTRLRAHYEPRITVEEGVRRALAA